MLFERGVKLQLQPRMWRGGPHFNHILVYTCLAKGLRALHAPLELFKLHP